MKKWFFLSLVIIILSMVIILLSGQTKGVSYETDAGTAVSIIGGADGYMKITMDAAKTIFEVPGDYIILDVRRTDEFEGGHIPGAINVPNEDIVDKEPAVLPDKNQTIYVYCRSGNRSKQAAEKLVNMGYTNIIEFGGILEWTGEIVKEKE